MITMSLSPLQQTAALQATDYWNDSCSIQELNYAIANGAVGATSNPTIVLAVLKKELLAWRERLNQIIESNPAWSEVEVAWKLIEEMGMKAAAVLLPVFERDLQHAIRGFGIVAIDVKDRQLCHTRDVS